MKLRQLFLPVLILSILFSGSMVQAQSKSEKEKEAKIKELEQKLEQALHMQEEELEKVLRQSKKIQDEELRQVLENQKKVQQQARENYKKAWEKNEDFYKDNWTDHKDFQTQKGYSEYLKKHNYKVVTPDMEFDFDVDADNFSGLARAFVVQAKERTALTIKKNLDDVTFDTKFKYEVAEGARGLNFFVEGSMDKGTLIVKLLKPNGEVLQDIEISPLADINWNQDLRWDEEDEQKSNQGNWVIVVSAKNATGSYKVNVRAN